MRWTGKLWYRARVSATATGCSQPQRHTRIAVVAIIETTPLVSKNISHNSQVPFSLPTFPPPALCSEPPKIWPTHNISFLLPKTVKAEGFSNGDCVCQSCGLVLGDFIVDTRCKYPSPSLYPSVVHALLSSGSAVYIPSQTTRAMTRPVLELLRTPRWRASTSSTP